MNATLFYALSTKKAFSAFSADVRAYSKWNMGWKWFSLSIFLSKWALTVSWTVQLEPKVNQACVFHSEKYFWFIFSFPFIAKKNSSHVFNLTAHSVRSAWAHSYSNNWLKMVVWNKCIRKNNCQKTCTSNMIYHFDTLQFGEKWK